MTRERSTRGSGICESWLAQQRYAQARRAIERYAPGAQSILDIGCGCVPIFLRTLRIPERWGLDKNAAKCDTRDGMTILQWDASMCSALPFAPGRFDVITMLAVWEHIPMPVLETLCHACHKWLRRGGVLIVTTPSPLGQMLLVPMMWMGLVSREEIDEHVSIMDREQIRHVLLRAGFSSSIVTYRFQLGLNQMIIAIKDQGGGDETSL